MHYFKQMVEEARRTGIQFYKSGSNSLVLVNPKDMEMFFHCVEEAEIFCFAPDGDVPAMEQSTDNKFSENVPVPFGSFSIEVAGGPVCGIAGVNETPGSEHYGKEFKGEIYCILTQRLMVGHGIDQKEIYVYYSLARRRLKGGYGEYMDNEARVFLSASLALTVEKYLKRLDHEREGQELVRERIRIGTGKTKRQHTIRRVIHVAPKALTPKYTLLNANVRKEVNWTHRWSRRGCWVNFYTAGPGSPIDYSKIGKNREGEYCVPGKTWRVDSPEVGPKDRPLIKKTRIVSGKTSTENG